MPVTARVRAAQIGLAAKAQDTLCIGAYASGPGRRRGCLGQGGLVSDNLVMGRVEVTAGSGRTLALELLSRPDEHLAWSYEATLTVPGVGAVSTVVHEMEIGQSLASYFRGLADAWRGFDGTKSFASLEGQLTIDARHDGLGTVWCVVGLQQVWPPEWALSASFDLGAGAYLDDLANSIEMFTR